MQSKSGVAPRAMISDRSTVSASGYPMFAVGLAMLLAGAVTAWMSFGHDRYGGISLSLPAAGLAALLVIGAFAVFNGLYTIQPNQSAVLVLFGKYVGTDSVGGFRWTNPFCTVKVVSRRTHSIETSVLKVNDATGTPLEIGAAVMWYVSDAARAALQVEDYAEFVKIQAEASVRTMANSHPYDHHDDPTADTTDAPASKEELKRVPSLLGGGDAITDTLTQELSDRLKVAGVTVAEARITHLAYAPEIAPAMLRRQQAQAVISAKKALVTGAVGIVKEALEMLKASDFGVEEDRRAALVSNLLVVLVADREATPVINTGSIYG